VSDGEPFTVRVRGVVAVVNGYTTGKRRPRPTTKILAVRRFILVP
jgi:hypothetical protein